MISTTSKMVKQHKTEKVTIDDPKPFYFVREVTKDGVKTGATRKSYMLKGTDHATGKSRSILASEANAKKFGKPELIKADPNKKKSVKKSCQEKFDECETKKAAKKKSAKKVTKKASKKDESDEEESEEREASDEQSEEVSEESPKPKRKPAKKAAKAKKSPAKAKAKKGKIVKRASSEY